VRESADVCKHQFFQLLPLFALQIWPIRAATFCYCVENESKTQGCATMIKIIFQRPYIGENGEMEIMPRGEAAAPHKAPSTLIAPHAPLCSSATQCTPGEKYKCVHSASALQHIYGTAPLPLRFATLHMNLKYPSRCQMPTHT